MDAVTATALAVALIALIGALSAALISRHQDREQQARSVLLAPADKYAEAALAVLAALRHVTPPRLNEPSVRPHRNEMLLVDQDLRNARLAVCIELLDMVRRTRGQVRLAFHPSSVVAEKSRQALEQLRLCLEAAEAFYEDHDIAMRRGLLPEWNGHGRKQSRDSYKRLRLTAYGTLDAYFEEVAKRLHRPRWTKYR